MTGMIEIIGKGILPRFTMKFLNLTLKGQEVGVEGNCIHGAELPSFTKITCRQDTTSTSLHFNLLRT